MERMGISEIYDCRFTIFDFSIIFTIIEQLLLWIAPPLRIADRTGGDRCRAFALIARERRYRRWFHSPRRRCDRRGVPWKAGGQSRIPCGLSSDSVARLGPAIRTRCPKLM